MPGFLHATLPTPAGQIAFVFEPARATGSITALFIHGLLQTAEDLLHWQQLLPPDIEPIYADLPGHGRSPAAGSNTIAAITERIRMAIADLKARPIVVIGASLGGLIALSLADRVLPQISGVIAGDPPLVTAKQWPIREALARAGARVSPYVRSLAEAALTPKDYYGLIGKAAVPTLILTGDVPLWPYRPANNVNLIDDADIDMIKRIGNPAISVRRITGCGHRVLGPDATGAIDIVREFCLRPN